jgi:hypothetical protein
LYGSTSITERHRHRYELNNDYREQLAKLGLVCSGLSPDYRLVEIIEIPTHPYFIATQFHPEFQSRPNRAHPLFSGLIAAAMKRAHRLFAPEEIGCANGAVTRHNGNGRGAWKESRGEMNVEVASEAIEV